MQEFNKRYLDFCEPFIDAIKETYSIMVKAEVNPGSPYIKENNLTLGDYSAVMGLNGFYMSGKSKRDFQGCLVLSWPLETYLKTANEMLKEEYTELSDAIKDLGAEICNITMGNAGKSLEERGYSIRASSSDSSIGKDHELKAQEGCITIVTPLKGDIGELSIELNYFDIATEPDFDSSRAP